MTVMLLEIVENGYCSCCSMVTLFWLYWNHNGLLTSNHSSNYILPNNMCLNLIIKPLLTDNVVYI